MKGNEQKQVSENGNKVVWKGPKLGVALVIGVILVILLGMQIYASTNGYGNVFFMLKTLVTGEAHGEGEIFNDKEITLSYKSVDVADGVKIQVNSLEIKENESTLCLHITAENPNNVLPLKYEIMSDGMAKTEVKGENEIKTAGDYDERLTVNHSFSNNEIVTLFIKDKDGKLLREVEINLASREIIVKGESEVDKISQIELKKYLSTFSRLNNDSDKENQIVQIAYDIHEIAAPGIQDAPEISKMNEAIKEFYGDKVEFVKDTNKAGKEIEIFKIDGQKAHISDRLDIYANFEDGDNTQKGICLKIEDIDFEDGIYTVKYIYTLVTKMQEADGKIEELPQYETTIKLKRNEDVKYSKYQVIEIEKGTEIKEKVSTEVTEDVKVDNNSGDNAKIMEALEEKRYLAKNNINNVHEVKYLKITDNIYFVNVVHEDNDREIEVVTSFVVNETNGNVIFDKLEEGKDYYTKYVDVNNKIIKAERTRREMCEDVFYDVSNGDYKEIDVFAKPVSDGKYLHNGNEITEKEYNEGMSKYESNSYIEFDKNAKVFNIPSDEELMKPVENVSNNNSAKFEGVYKFASETSNYYHNSMLIIGDSSDESIDFKISTSHGRDVDHVNIGELKGVAKKIDVPEDMKVPESTQYAYQYVDEIDGKTNTITFVYTAHRQFEYINIKEDYATENNPYAGHNVWFEGEYEKIAE